MALLSKSFEEISENDLTELLGRRQIIAELLKSLALPTGWIDT